MSGFRCQFCKGSLTKVHYPKLYNMAHLLSLNVFTASKGSNNYILFIIKKSIDSVFLLVVMFVMFVFDVIRCYFSFSFFRHRHFEVLLF